MKLKKKETADNSSNIDSNIQGNIVEKQGFQLTVAEKYSSLFTEENLEILSNIIKEKKS